MLHSSRGRLIALAALLTILACRQGTPAQRTATTAATRSDPAATPSSPVTTEQMVVHKDPNCGCCTSWVDYVRSEGFAVTVNDVANLDAVKSRLGVPARLQACHTAEIAGYTIEGHVPADLIRRLLRERPQIAGIAVAGMPAGSPGMEIGYKQPYDVIAFTRDGGASVYARR